MFAQILDGGQVCGRNLNQLPTPKSKPMTRLLLCVFKYLTVLLLFGFFSASAQQAVSGKVTSADDGSGVPGVNVIEKGTSNGAVTDTEGKFNLTVSANATLVFSFIGYKTQEIVVGSQTTINVSLVSDVTALAEVVVTGYGSQEKKDISGAVVSMKPESFNKGNINDPAQLLQGKVAGVSITKAGNDPNEPFSIRLRGITTVGANTSPLFVIDGVIGADYKALDPNDIASMDILKDGAAASIYGTRASSGVILITTKKGQAGKPKLEFSTYASAERIAKFVPVMGAQEYISVGGKDLGSNTNWKDQVTQTGYTQVYNVGLSGGSGGTSYRLSLNYRDVNGIVLYSGWKQINTRLDLQQKAFNDHLRLNFNVSNNNRESNYSFPNALKYAVLYNPTAPVFDPSGANAVTGSPYFEQSLFDLYNPVAMLKQNTSVGTINTINISVKADIDIVPIKGLTGTVTYALQRQAETLASYYSKTAYYVGFGTNGLANRSVNEKQFGLLEMYASYNKTFGDLNLTAVGGYSYQSTTTSGFGISAGNFLSDALGYNQLGNSLNQPAGKNVIGSYASPDQKIIGFFGRANLNYKETYFLSGSIRREGSTAFGEGNKWGTFGGVSGSAILSNLFTVPGFSSLKLRASYGLTGALPITYGLSQIQYGQTGGFSYLNGNLIPVVSTTLAPNPNLKWETKTEYNAGLDMGFLDNRLKATVDVYQREASNFILLRPIDASTHVAAQQYLNLGKIRTRGIELSVNYAVIQSGDFTWNTTLVGTHLKSILVSYLPGTETPTGLAEPGSDLGSPGQNSTYLIQNIAGQQVGTIWGQTYQGVDSKGNPILSATSGKLGNGLPQADLGWTNNFVYKNWDFNFFLRGTFGHSLVNSYRAFYEPVVAGQIVSYNRVKTKFFDPNITNPVFSSYYVEKAGFVKLDNITLGYNIPVKAGGTVTRFRVYAAGNNLFTITNYTGVDPEARLIDYGDAGFVPGINNLTQGNVLAAGIDRRNSYFRSRTFTLGLNLTF